MGDELDHDVHTKMSNPSPELVRLEPVLGKWQTRARTEDSILRSGGQVTSVEETVTWWLRDESGEFKPWMTNVFSRVNDAVLDRV